MENAMRKSLIALLVSMGVAMTALAEVFVNIGINVPTYPVLQRIPNYPVYYAPALRTNYFFYDGLYWVFDGNEWYASAWYNGPWDLVDRFEVPVYLLRVPVRYYRYAPATFRSWRVDAAPRWDVYWGGTWSSRRAGWDRWDVRSAPAAAPLPLYQRQYTGDRYPRVEQQAVIQSRSYRYEPKERVAREVLRERRVVADARASSAPGLQRSETRGPPDHAVAKGLRERGDDGRRPPDHAVARGHDRDERGIPAHAHGKAKGHDEDGGRGRGRGRDKD
jgi:hypothetical protein